MKPKDLRTKVEKLMATIEWMDECGYFSPDNENYHPEETRLLHEIITQLEEREHIQ